jgi:UDP-N-acetylglucosamine acyltransferase
MPVAIADSAWVDPRARIEDGAEIGPFCVVGPLARIGPRTRLLGHVCLIGPVSLGADNVVHPFTTLGGEPAGSLDIGDRNRIGSGASIAPGGPEPTRIGHDNLLHAALQIGPGCEVADRVSLGSASVLGARVRVESGATLAAAVVVHHDVTVGALGFVAAQSRLAHDVPPYMIVDGHPARVRCIHAAALKRARVPAASIHALHEAHRLLYRARLAPAQAAEVLAAHGHVTPETERLLASVLAQQGGRHGRAREAAGELRTSA